MTFGSNLDIVWRDDPKLLGIRCARYKFVAKMIAGTETALEVGAGDGILAKIVEQTVGWVLKTDKEPQGDDVIQADFIDGSISPEVDAVYCLDVLEHVDPVNENAFVANLRESLKPFGTCIVGMPSLESQKHASEISKAGHVNCKTEEELKALMKKYFWCVYMFGMNDEVVHTGFGPLCHYRFAVCNTKR